MTHGFACVRVRLFRMGFIRAMSEAMKCSPYRVGPIYTFAQDARELLIRKVLKL